MISKRQLYSLGEPLGDCVTRIEAGRVVYGGGGKSSSSSTSSTTTQNTDKRLVVSSGVGVSSDSSTVNVSNTTVDADVVKSALDVIVTNDATNAKGLSDLLSTERANVAEQAKSYKALTDSLAKQSSDFAAASDAMNRANSGNFGALLSSFNDANSGLNKSQEKGFQGLLNLADSLFVGSANLINKAQDATLSQIAAVTSAANDKSGSIDQKTISLMVMGGVAVAGMLVFGGKK